MNVLSLFDGMSGGQLGLQKAGIEVDNYFASEIDKYAMAVTQYRFPETIQLGSVLDIDIENLPKIDLLIAGSPCQGFSLAGKQLNFDDDRSKLFFEFVRILNFLQPKYFQLENVKMKQEFKDVISNLVGVEPIEINSALLSAQNRKRLYWTNIPGVKQPKDKGVMLKDILEDGEINRDKAYTPREPKNACGAFRGRYKVNGVRQDGKMKVAGLTQQELEVRADGKTNALTTVQKDNVVVLLDSHKSKDGLKCVAGLGKNKKWFDDGKSPTVKTGCSGGTIPKIRDKSKCVRSCGRGSYDRHEWDSVDECHWRKLTPLECERLQTVPDNYTLVPWQKRMMSNSQRYKMLGNGFTCDVIAHILKGIKNV